MDLICPKCGDPTDNDYLHDLVVQGDFASYHDALHAFQARGCEALDMPCNPEGRGSLRAAVSEAMFDLLGDDADGAASMMEDFEMMGLL